MTYEDLIKQVQTHTYWEKIQLHKMLFAYGNNHPERTIKKLLSDNLIVERDNVYFVL